MRLETISAKNLQGASFELKLAVLTLITGGNFKGKTRVANAIKLALLGFLPFLDRTARSIFQLASGALLEIRADVVNEWQDDAGSKNSAHWPIHRAWEEVGGKIKTATHVPDVLDGKTPVVMLDAGEYFSASPRKRIEMVFSVATITDGASVADISAAVTKEVSAETAKEFNRLASTPHGATVQEWLEKAVTLAEQNRSDRDRETRMLSGVLQGNTALSNERPAPTRSIEAIDADIEAAAGQMAKDRADYETLQREHEQSEVNDLKRDQLKQQIEDAGGPPEREYDIEALRARHRDVSKRLQDAQTIAARAQRWDDEQAMRKRLIQVAQTAWETARDEPVDTKVVEETCSECGRAYGTTSKEKKAVIAGRKERKKKEVTKLAARLHDLEQESEKVPARPVIPDSVEVDRAELAEINEQIDAYIRDAKTIALVAKLNGLPAPVDHSEKLKALNESIEAAGPKIELLRQERRSAEMERNDQQRLAEARRKHDAADAAEKEWKKIKNLLIEWKGKLIEQVFGPLLETANVFTENIFKSPIEYRDGELGYDSHISFGSHEGRSVFITDAVFSGTEEALLHASLQCALGAQSPCRIVIVDELGRLDDRNAVAFLHNVAKAQEAEMFEQFIGITPRDMNGPKGFTRIEALGDRYEVR